MPRIDTIYTIIDQLFVIDLDFYRSERMDTPPLQQNTGHTLAPGNRPPPTLAPGFQAIVGACQRLYPEQKNPLQISTVVKYWLGKRGLISITPLGNFFVKYCWTLLPRNSSKMYMVEV